MRTSLLVRWIFILSLLSLSAHATEILDIKSDVESSISKLGLQKTEFVIEGKYKYLDVYFDAITDVGNCWMETETVIKTRISQIYPPHDFGHPVYLVSSIPKKRNSCGWADPKVLKERFLTEFRDQNGIWQPSFGRERGAVYLVKGRNGNGEILTIYHLDMRDLTNILFRQIEKDAPVINVEYLTRKVLDP